MQQSTYQANTFTRQPQFSAAFCKRLFLNKMVYNSFDCSLFYIMHEILVSYNKSGNQKQDGLFIVFRRDIFNNKLHKHFGKKFFVAMRGNKMKKPAYGNARQLNDSEFVSA